MTHLILITLALRLSRINFLLFICRNKKQKMDYSWKEEIAIFRKRHWQSVPILAENMITTHSGYNFPSVCWCWDIKTGYDGHCVDNLMMSIAFSFLRNYSVFFMLSIFQTKENISQNLPIAQKARNRKIV